VLNDWLRFFFLINSWLPNNSFKKKTKMTALSGYDINIDEIRVALSYANANVVLKPVEVSLAPVVALPAPVQQTSKEVKIAPAATAPKSASKADDDDDDFDVFGDDDEAKEDEDPKESRADMLARLKKEAEERTAQKEAKQRTLVAIEVKPWDVEQDLMVLWKKITTTITQDGLKWGESCTLADVAFGIKKIQCTFVMGVKNSSDDVVDAILAMEDEVQSCEVTSMNVL
jgi:translation elongation factor EF-1beta